MTTQKWINDLSKVELETLVDQQEQGVSEVMSGTRQPRKFCF